MNFVGPLLFDVQKHTGLLGSVGQQLTGGLSLRSSGLGEISREKKQQV